MIAQAGPRYEGSVALSCSEPLDDLGLIEIYETVLDRGADLSIRAGFNDPDANNALLLAASRIADLYLLLGNEAYADASDPTVGLDGAAGDYGTATSALWAARPRRRARRARPRSGVDRAPPSGPRGCGRGASPRAGGR